MDVRMAAALAGAVPNVSAFCLEQGITRQTFYKWRRRFREGGVDALAERSHARIGPFSERTGAEVVEAVVRWRKQLAEIGADHGPDSIRAYLLRGAAEPRVAAQLVPSRSTIARILSARGMVVPAPQKRPRSSYTRFVYPRPNECWQSDWTQWSLADGTPVAIAGTLDDHSRLLAGIGAAPGDGTAALVWAVMTAAITRCGVPVRSLTDNGLCYSMARRGGSAAFEVNLRALGTQPIASSPFHPQTCGKIERFWQTLKKWLNAHDPAATIDELTALLDAFAVFYNDVRPHRALPSRRTPAEAFNATVKARPASHPLPAPLTVSRAVITANGLAHTTGHTIGVGARWAGHPVEVIRDGDHVVIFAGTRIVRELTLDPARTYQPGGARYDLRGTREPHTLAP